MTHNLVIRGGTVVDGSGFGAYRADVGVADGRIVEVGNIRARGVEEIDADGLVVSPGFIDGHTHLDAQLFWDHHAQNSCWHGVTTVVTGNCGFTLAPARADARELVVRNLERAEDMDPASLEQGIEWTWEDFPQFLDAVERVPKGVNYAANVGHSALRTWAMGERAFEQPADADDLALMRSQLEAAMRAGAIGFSTSRNQHHETSDDRPVASRLAEWTEVLELAGVLSGLGTGMVEAAIEGADSDDPEQRDRVWRELHDLTVGCGVPLTFGLVATRDGGSRLLDMIDSIGRQGGRVIGQTHCRGISVLLSFKTRVPFDILPEWQPLRSMSIAEQLVRLRDPETRRSLARVAMEADYRWRGIGAMPRKPDWEGIRVFANGLPPNPTIGDVARQRGITPAEAMIDLAVETDFEAMFIQPSLYPQDDETLLRAMRHPRTVMTFSDSGAHLSQIADASIHTFLLGHWVRQREELTLEEAVRSITFAPAMAWGFDDRGLIRAGMAADINVFDPATIGPAVPTVVEDLPGGAKRLSQRADGIVATIVNGTITLRDGELTGRFPGRLLRRHPR